MCTEHSHTCNSQSIMRSFFWVSLVVSLLQRDNVLKIGSLLKMNVAANSMDTSMTNSNSTNKNWTFHDHTDYNLTTPSPVTTIFICDDGCSISTTQFNDSFCNCRDCSDEPLYTCDTCLNGCPNQTYTGIEDPCIVLPSWCGETGLIQTGPLNGSFICIDGCVAPSQVVNDGVCNCIDCADEFETGWSCTSCFYGCLEPEYLFCSEITRPCDGDVFSTDEFTFICDDGCTIDFAPNDGYCDCSNCEDEDDYNCDTCATGCPDTCGDYRLCNAQSFGFVLYHFLYDCNTNSWQEGIVIGLEVVALFINVIIVAYFMYQMKIIADNHKVMKLFLVLVSFCNISYLIALVLCIAKTYNVFTGWSWCDISNNDRISIDIEYICWEKMIYFAFIMVYITFSFRFEVCIRGSIFESNGVKYYLITTCIVLIILWIWSIIASILYYIPRWRNNENSTSDLKNSVVDYQLLTDLDSNATNIMLGTYSCFSLMSLLLFAIKFRQFAELSTEFSNQESSSPHGIASTRSKSVSKSTLPDSPSGSRSRSTSKFKPSKAEKQRYGVYLAVVSRTVLLSIVALASTVSLILVVTAVWTSLFDDDNSNPYIYEYIGIIYGIDSTINILCLNMNFTHGFDLYNKIGCKKIENQLAVCVVWCFVCGNSDRHDTATDGVDHIQRVHTQSVVTASPSDNRGSPRLQVPNKLPKLELQLATNSLTQVEEPSLPL